MDKFFANLWLVVAVGFGLALVLMGLPEFSNAPGAQNGYATAAFQWLHVLFGILWIGLLYYLNFVQVPSMAAMPAEHKPGVTKLIAPKALFYFRWAALLTVITGAILATTVRRASTKR